MAASIVQFNEGAENTGDATVDATLDSAATAGNLIVLCVGSDDYNNGNPTDFTLPTEGEQETFMGLYLWWKVAVGGEQTVQYAIGSAATSCWAIVEISGLEASPFDDCQGQFAQSSSESYTTANITPTTGERFLLALMGFTRSANFTSLGTWLNSFTAVNLGGVGYISTTRASGTRDQIGVATRAVTGDGSTAFSSGATSDGAGTATSRAAIITSWKVASGGATVNGTALGAFTFAATASGTKTVNGTAAGNFAFSGTAAGTRTVTGQAASAFAFTATAAGTKTVNGVASTAVTFTAPAAGTRTVLASAVGAFTFTATASGTTTHEVTGTAVSNFAFSGAASGVRTVLGQAATSVAFGANASGQRTVVGTAGTAGVFSASVAGVRTVLGQAVGAFTFMAVAVAEGAGHEPTLRISHISGPQSTVHVARSQRLSHAAGPQRITVQ